MKPRVLLLQPASFPSRSQDFGVPHLLALAGWIERECGVEPVVRDLRHERDPDAALREAVADSRPVLIGVSCYASFDQLDALEAARKARAAAPTTPLIAGGYQASACPEELLLPAGPFDFVVVGDGERPLAEVVRWALDGGARPPSVLVADRPIEPGELPPSPFRLLERYAARARSARVKLQVNLSRGCPHACTFCMERAKPDRVWRALPPERAVEELRRLDRVFPVGDSLLHFTDPLFGAGAAWRREFLGRLAASGLRPRAAWTLTRAEGLSEDDLRLAAECRLSFGIGLESGSPAMLLAMRKTARPDDYLQGFLRLREKAERAGASWAVNVLVGHPGETPGTVRESLAFLDELFPADRPTRGWLSVDPFRLYPGSDVHRRMEAWSAEHGARFHVPDWWRRPADRDVTPELVDPSATLDVFERLDRTYSGFRAVVLRAADSFRCDDERSAPIFARSLEEQREAFAPEMYERRRRIFAMLHPDARLTAAPPRLALALPIVEDDVALAAVAACEAGGSGGARWAVVGAGRDAAVEAALRGADRNASVAWIRTRPGALRRVLVRLGPAVSRRPRTSWLAAALRARAGSASVALALGAHPDVPRALSAWVRARAGRRAVVVVGPRFGLQRVLLLAAHSDGGRHRTIAFARLPPAAGDDGWLE
ncbi:MAG: B12-binding domain-containing radical SAM protein [Deltaproteobacteria bacterium]|nr:B12-binding domain-containing radical SAM protein [Deltaproteobacteria bacterium]